MLDLELAIIEKHLHNLEKHQLDVGGRPRLAEHAGEPAPKETQLDLFRGQCAQKGLVYDEGEILAFVRALLGSGRALATCQPRDLLEQVVDHAVYRGERPTLTADALQRASATYFARFR